MVEMLFWCRRVCWVFDFLLVIGWMWVDVMRFGVGGCCLYWMLMEDAVKRLGSGWGFCFSPSFFGGLSSSLCFLSDLSSALC